jgi:hypothetical protein
MYTSAVDSLDTGRSRFVYAYVYWRYWLAYVLLNLRLSTIASATAADQLAAMACCMVYFVYTDKLSR